MLDIKYRKCYLNYSSGKQICKIFKKGFFYMEEKETKEKKVKEDSSLEEEAKDIGADKKEEDEPEESWEEFYHRRLSESGKTVTPNIGWYLAEEIFYGKKTIPYFPVSCVIPLPGPYLNIWALKDPKHNLEKTLGISEKDIEKVNYYASYIVTSGKGDIAAGAVLNENEYRDAMEKYGDAFTAGYGAEGLLEYAQNTGRKMPGILCFFPIVYACEKGGSMRNRRFEAELRIDLAHLYIKLLGMKDRVERLDSLHAPEIIMRNEKRMLQELLDSIIQNGLRGPEKMNPWGLPMYSLIDITEEK